jgi:hypothetical protein
LHSYTTQGPGVITLTFTIHFDITLFKKPEGMQYKKWKLNIKSEHKIMVLDMPKNMPSID